MYYFIIYWNSPPKKIKTSYVLFIHRGFHWPSGSWLVMGWFLFWTDPKLLCLKLRPNYDHPIPYDETDAVPFRSKAVLQILEFHLQIETNSIMILMKWITCLGGFWTLSVLNFLFVFILVEIYIWTEYESPFLEGIETYFLSMPKKNKIDLNLSYEPFFTHITISFFFLFWIPKLRHFRWSSSWYFQYTSFYATVFVFC